MYHLLLRTETGKRSEKMCISVGSIERLTVLYLFLVCCGVSHANYRSDGGFQPSTSFQRTEDQVAQPASRLEKALDSNDLNTEASQQDRTQRFGISTYGSTGSAGTPYGTSPGLYGPLKIDLGGVLLGSIIGFGAVLVLPKIIHAFSYSYGGYGRSEGDSGMLQVSDMLSKLDETLSRYNIDSSTCMQRIACSYVQLARENVNAGNGTEIDELVASLSGNTLVQRMLDGSSVLDAFNAGRSSDVDCHERYSKCELDKKTILKMLSHMLP